MQTDATSANNSQHCWVLLPNNVASVCMGLKFDRFQTIRNKCQQCCDSMQTDATSHNIIGSNNVGCCWPTMLGLFAWAFTAICVTTLLEMVSIVTNFNDHLRHRLIRVVGARAVGRAIVSPSPLPPIENVQRQKNVRRTI